MAPKVTITPHCANIKDSQTFPLSFFASFDLVLNALDNLGMCTCPLALPAHSAPFF